MRIAIFRELADVHHEACGTVQLVQQSSRCRLSEAQDYDKHGIGRCEEGVAEVG